METVGKITVLSGGGARGGEAQPPLSTSVLELIGNTPLLQVPGTRVFAKAEWANPGGSVKDRPALRMIEEAERTGALRKGKTLIDATSGNTGIAYALICAAKGYPVELCLPANASPERKKILAALGAKLIFTSPMEMTDGAILEARKRVEADPDRYFYPDQYSNPENWKAHYHTTGPEIWKQTEGRVTHFLAGLGTSGTFVGAGRFLKEKNPGIQLISMEPDSPYHGLEGMKHMETAMVPAIYDTTLADQKVEIMTEDAHTEARRLARECGWFVGVSAAANVLAARRVADELGEDGVVVTILCDGGMKYLSDAFWEASD